ncbi:MAG: hypothetical protein JWM34_1585 [Ilumatobacteraceae bacterium]|nr:hypothetical protein [Ilumatobacteraceae bacterium]
MSPISCAPARANRSLIRSKVALLSTENAKWSMAPRDPCLRRSPSMAVVGLEDVQRHTRTDGHDLHPRVIIRLLDLADHHRFECLDEGVHRRVHRRRQRRNVIDACRDHGQLFPREFGVTQVPPYPDETKTSTRPPSVRRLRLNPDDPDPLPTPRRTATIEAAHRNRLDASQSPRACAVARWHRVLNVYPDMNCLPAARVR